MRLEGGAGLIDPEMASDFGRTRPGQFVAPGEIDTGSCRRAPRDRRAADPLHRLGTPDEVAKIIYVLCTETSST